MPEALPLLPLLVEWAAFFLALACCVLASYIVWALFGAAEKGVGWIPWAGKWLKGSLHTIEQRISNKLGQAVAALDHRMSLTFYRMAHIVEWVGNELKANAGLLAVLANLIANPNSIAAWRQAINGAHTAINGVAGSIGGKVHALTHPVTAQVTALQRWTHSQIRALHNTIAVTIPGEFAGLRKRAKALEDARLRHFDWLKRIDARFAAKAFAGLVAAALVYLNLSWLRCGKLKTRGPALCNLDDALFAALLADSLLILGTLSLEQFAREMVGVTDTAVRPITTFWRAS